MQQQVWHSRTVHSAHTVFMFFSIYLGTKNDVCHFYKKLVCTRECW